MLSKPLGLNSAGLTVALDATGTGWARDAIPSAQASRSYRREGTQVVIKITQWTFYAHPARTYPQPKSSPRKFKLKHYPSYHSEQDSLR
jgi:hypothetical protein